MYSFTGRVRFSETGQDRRLTLLALLDYFQDCSTFQSEDLGVGIDYLRQKNEAWVLNYWQIVVEEYPKLGETIQICTLPYEFKGCMGSRNFFLLDSGGRRIAVANSLWTLLNMKKMHPVRPSAEMLARYGREDRLPMDYEPRKIALSGEGKKEQAIHVQPHHLDCNGHVNNGQYVRMAACFLPEGRRVRQLRAEYRKQALPGEVLLPYLYPGEERFAVSLCDGAGSPCAIVEFG